MFASLKIFSSSVWGWVLVFGGLNGAVGFGSGSGTFVSKPFFCSKNFGDSLFWSIFMLFLGVEISPILFFLDFAFSLDFDFFLSKGAGFFYFNLTINYYIFYLEKISNRDFKKINLIFFI